MRVFLYVNPESTDLGCAVSLISETVFSLGIKGIFKKIKGEKEMKKTFALILAVLMLTACCTAYTNGNKDDNPTQIGRAHV